MLDDKDAQPQVLQGRWQAYGQMRAARTVGRFAVLTSGVLGGGLWKYQQELSSQAKENKKDKEDLKQAQKELYDREIEICSRIKETKESYEDKEKQVDRLLKLLREAEKCHDDSNVTSKAKCVENYKQLKAKI